MNPNEIHIWSTNLAISTADIETRFTYLSKTERERAERFHFPIHQQRFIAARGGLRIILGQYLHTSPAEINILEDEHQKPYLANYPLHFNLSHSDHMAVYAIASQQVIGVDIEKMNEPYHPDIPARFFSETENATLNALPAHQQCHAFYQLWSRKEAVLKATGHGLRISLSSFSVSVNSVNESVSLENKIWYVSPLTIHPDFAAAIASDQMIQKILYRTI
jgi:4'-phosphopantetheinyl transferase